VAPSNLRLRQLGNSPLDGTAVRGKDRWPTTDAHVDDLHLDDTAMADKRWIWWRLTTGGSLKTSARGSGELDIPA
jgi:hypothetical protein